MWYVSTVCTLANGQSDTTKLIFSGLVGHTGGMKVITCTSRNFMLFVSKSRLAHGQSDMAASHVWFCRLVE